MFDVWRVLAVRMAHRITIVADNVVKIESHSAHSTDPNTFDIETARLAAEKSPRLTHSNFVARLHRVSGNV